MALDTPQIGTRSSLAYALSSLVMPASMVFPFWTQTVLVTLLTLGSAVLLGHELGEGDKEEPAEARRQNDKPDVQPDMLQPGEAKRLLAKIAVSSVAFSFVLNVVRFLYERQDQNSFDLGPVTVITLSAVVAGAIVLAVLLCSRRLDLAFSYRPVLWLLALGCFLLPLLNQGSALPYFFARTGYVSFTILAWVMLSDLAYRSTISSFKIFGIGQASCSLGLALGALLGRMAGQTGFSPYEHSIALSGVLVFALIVMYTLILTERDISHAILKPSRKRDQKEGPASKRSQTAGRCEALATRHGLGERATEVLTLYSSGRSRTRIEQELYISKGTVNFHLRNIYLALGVHSRQELLDMLDDETLDQEYYD